MSRGQYVALVLTFILCVAGIALIAISIGTDNWYRVQRVDSPENNTFHFGLWRECYENEIPTGIAEENLLGPDNNCVYRKLVREQEWTLSWQDQRYMHLTRCHVSLICTSCVVQLATLLVLIFGLWPSGSCNCKSLSAAVVYMGAAILSFIAALAGMAGGISFIALRDIDEEQGVHSENDLRYFDWSFILAWISTGLCLVQSAILVYLNRFSYAKRDYYYTSKHYLL